MINHCKTGVHCQKCGRIQRNQRLIFGTVFPCPFPEREILAPKLIQRQAVSMEELERRRVEFEKYLSFAVNHREDFIFELEAYEREPTCSTKRPLVEAVKKFCERRGLTF